MTLTIDSDWLREFRRAHVQPVLWMRLEALNTTITSATTNTSTTITPSSMTGLVVGMEVTGTGIPALTTITVKGGSTVTISNAATVTNGTAAITYIKVFNFLSAASDNIEGQICIETVAPITQSLDPYSRELTSDESNINFVDDGVIRRVNGTYPLVGKKVIIRLGVASLGITEFADYFTGFIADVIPVEGSIEVRCTSFVGMLEDRVFGGSFYSKHPLVVLKQLIEAAGVPTTMIDANSFDPDQSVYDDIRHFTITSVSMKSEPAQQVISPIGGSDYISSVGGGRRSRGWSTDAEGYPGPDNIMQIRELVDHIVFWLAGMLYIDAGKFKFKLFDTSASVARHLTTSDYNDFKQLEAQNRIINELRINISDGKFITLSDAASVTEYGKVTQSEKATFTTAKTFIIPLTVGSPFDAAKSSGDAIAEEFYLKNVQTSGVAGLQGTGDDGNGALTFATNAAGYVSASRFGVLEHLGELMKITEIEMQTTSLGYGVQVSDEGLVQVETYAAEDLILTEVIVNKVKVVSGTRGLGHTIPNTIPDAAWDFMQLVSGGNMALDVTIPYFWGTNYALPRFGNGLAQCEITVPLHHWDLEVGDLISIDNDVFLWRNIDGVSSTSKFEIVGKEIDPLSDEPKIKLTIAAAVLASTPSQTITYAVPKMPAMMKNRTNGGVPGIPYTPAASVSAVPSGGATARKTSTDYDVVIDSGAATLGTSFVQWSENLSLKGMTASKDHYVSVDHSTGLFITDMVSAGNKVPEVAASHSTVCKVVAGGSNITSVGDERQLATIAGSQIDGQSVDLGQLVSSPFFDRWQNGTLAPPIGWTSSAGVWGTDQYQDHGQYRTGRFSLAMPATGTVGSVLSNEISVIPSEIYEADVWVRSSNNSSNFQVKIDWITNARAAISTSTVIDTSADSATTWEQKLAYAAAPATAAFAKIYLSRTASGATVWWDSIKLRRATPSFSAYLSSDQSPTTNDRIDFDTEDHDHGDWFSTGGQKAAAPTAGVYCFNFSIKVEASTDAKVVNVLIRKNATAYNNGTALKTFVLGDIDAGAHVMFSYTFEALKLEAADYVNAYITFSSGQPVIGGGATESSFSGRRVN